MEKCRFCGRPILFGEQTKDKVGHGPIKTVEVYHSFYGCDTGCCGHRVEAYDAKGKFLHGKFMFEHPYDNNFIAFARELAAQAFREGDYEVVDTGILDD